jgi:hypothetical protein
VIIFKTPNGLIDQLTRGMLQTPPFDGILPIKNGLAQLCPYRPYRTDMGDRLRPRTDMADNLRSRVDMGDQLRPRTDECR